METAKVRQCGFLWNVRIPVPWHDINIITEVIGNDEYGITELRRVIGNNVKTILDVGGHIGSFGVFARSLWPGATLIAVEPEPMNSKLYEMNLKENGLWDEKCHILQAAVGYNPECNHLVHSPSTTGGNVMRTKKEAEKYISQGYRFYNSVTVDDVALLTVEDILNNYGIQRFDLAKWDCEGGEIDAFKNITPEAASKFLFMIGEYHIWDENSGYLKAPLCECQRFWRQARRRFRHLNFSYNGDYTRLGLFQAWPKEIN